MNIELTSTDGRRPTFRLDTLPALVGSDPCADLCVNLPGLSPLHCMIDQVAGTLCVHDLVSQSGTFVNGRRVDESPLMPGDRLTLGEASFRVDYQPAAKRRPDPSQATRPFEEVA